MKKLKIYNLKEISRILTTDPAVKVNIRNDCVNKRYEKPIGELRDFENYFINKYVKNK